MTGDLEDGAADDDCVLPPDHPVPADELGRYSPERDYDAEQDISDYMAGQARDETVQHVERVKTEYVLGDPYEMWDVTTDKERWWVISNPTNLYSQKHFPSLDYTLSFHIGLMLRVQSRQEKPGVGEESPFGEVFRRQRQAGELLERAIEAVDLQAVGMQLREVLLALVGSMRRRVELQEQTDRPQDANFIAWTEILLNHLCPGEKNKELRQYLKVSSDKAWQLVNWLTHHKNAAKTSTMIAYDAVGVVAVSFITLLRREREDRKDKCPTCSSRNIRTFYDASIAPDGAYFETCGQCGWSSHPGYEVEVEERDPIEVLEAQLSHASAEHAAWVRKGNKSMIAFSTSLVSGFEKQIAKMRAEAASNPA